MVHVAKEMKRRNMTIPLLIGGATTSRTHTAVKIAQEYAHGVVHVLDASRSVTVVSSLLNAVQKPIFLNQISVEYQKLREDFARKKTTKQYLSIQDAQERKVAIDWEGYTPPVPAFTGVRYFKEYDLAEIATMIDWGPFFLAWEMPGRFPAVLEDARVGVEATKLYNDARQLLQRIIDEKWLTANAAIGFWPAGTEGDDIIIDVDGRSERLCHLRQQIKKAVGQPQFCLSDYKVKPAALPGPGDYVGGFVVTAGVGIEKWIEHFEKQHDDYNSILLKALADRLAEAFAERLHLRVRREFWGYAAGEELTTEDLVAENYQGIRPAPGYPACPDHTEKIKLFDLLDATRQTGIELTESLAMYPASSVSGWYFSHPQSTYFGVGKIEKDQVEQYARRKDMPIEEIERWLRPNLDYDA